jgi:hypothetical protein
MRFQLFSDLHLEFLKHGPKPKVLAPNLILAGDIGKLNTPGWNEFMQYCSESWDCVLYVLGNHEFYHSKKPYSQLEAEYSTYLSKYPNIHLLHNSSFELDGFEIYGFIGWTRSPFSSLSEAQNEINDYNCVWESKGKLARPEFFTGLANDSIGKFKSWIESSASNPNSKPKIIITHFPPIRTNTSNPMYLSGPPRIVNKYFAWDNMIESESIDCTQIKLWISGHTHWSYDFVTPIHGIRYLANQAGYKEEFVAGETGFDDSKVFTL